MHGRLTSIVSSYHWAFIIGPKIEADGKMGVRYYAKESMKAGGRIEWAFQERECPLEPTSMLLVRVMIGKVEDKNRLAEILRQTPIKQGSSRMELRVLGKGGPGESQDRWQGLGHQRY